MYIYTISVHVMILSSNEIHQLITYVSVNHCIYFKYSLCTLKPGEKHSACSPASMR